MVPPSPAPGGGAAPRRRIRLLDARFPGRGAFDTAVSRALMQAVACAEGAECLRLYPTDDVLAFSVLDRTRPGFARACDAARAAGFEPVVRLAGGRAAVFHRATLAFAWSRPAPDLRAGIHERFAEMAGLLVEAFRELGVDARVGEIPGEYCPGSHSVHAGGRTKLAGIGQRVVRGAAHVGGVVVVGGSDRVREALVPVYRELGYGFDPATAGSLEDELGRVELEEAAEAIRAAFRRRYDLTPARLDGAVLERAAALEAEHVPGGAPPERSPVPLEGVAKGVREPDPGPARRRAGS